MLARKGTGRCRNVPYLLVAMLPTSEREGRHLRGRSRDVGFPEGARLRLAVPAADEQPGAGRADRVSCPSLRDPDPAERRHVTARDETQYCRDGSETAPASENAEERLHGVRRCRGVAGAARGYRADGTAGLASGSVPRCSPTGGPGRSLAANRSAAGTRAGQQSGAARRRPHRTCAIAHRQPRTARRRHACSSIEAATHLHDPFRRRG
jgi:hypothetical protein